LDRRLGEPQSQSGHGGEEKNSQSLPGIEARIIINLTLTAVSESNEHEVVNLET
jgi:hypothetical protein